jgi:hypothetical protein
MSSRDIIMTTTVYAGFDTDIYPGKAQLVWLKANTNLSWCGYYLAPAPNHPDTTWMGQRQALVDAGWGLLPIYVGRQAPEPGSTDPIGPQGSADGDQAAHMARCEGFPPQSYIFIDWEDGGTTLGMDVKAYLSAWALAVVKGGYQPGIYCSHELAAAMAQVMGTLDPAPAVRLWAWHVSTTGDHPYTGSVTNLPTPDPAGCGFASAVAWQHEQNCALTLPDAPEHTMKVDLSSSSLADPGAPD